MAPSGILATSIPSLSFLLVCSLASRSVNGMERKGEGAGENIKIARKETSFLILYNILLAGITFAIMLLFYFGGIENTLIKIIGALFVPFAGFVINIFILIGWRWSS